MRLAVCAILPSAWKNPEEAVKKLLVDIAAAVSRLPIETTIFFTCERAGREQWVLFDELRQGLLSSVQVQLVESRQDAVSTTSASLYLQAYINAITVGADFLLEIDLSGAHDPSQIESMLKRALELHEVSDTGMVAILSTRFAKGGRDYFPRDRVLLSKAGTLFAHKLLMLGRHGNLLTDLTSGYELFSSALVKKMFELLPPSKWVSMWWGPVHLFQTEIRALVCWIAKRHTVTLEEVPITFAQGFTRKLAPLKFSYLIKALAGGFLLILEGFRIQRVLNKSSA